MTHWCPPRRHVATTVPGNRSRWTSTPRRATRRAPSGQASGEPADDRVRHARAARPGVVHGGGVPSGEAVGTRGERARGPRRRPTTETRRPPPRGSGRPGRPGRPPARRPRARGRPGRRRRAPWGAPCVGSRRITRPTASTATPAATPPPSARARLLRDRSASIRARSPAGALTESTRSRIRATARSSRIPGSPVTTPPAARRPPAPPRAPRDRSPGAGPGAGAW